MDYRTQDNPSFYLNICEAGQIMTGKVLVCPASKITCLLRSCLYDVDGTGSMNLYVCCFYGNRTIRRNGYIPAAVYQHAISVCHCNFRHSPVLICT